MIGPSTTVASFVLFVFTAPAAADGFFFAGGFLFFSAPAAADAALAVHPQGHRRDKAPRGLRRGACCGSRVAFEAAASGAEGVQLGHRLAR